MKWKLGRSRFDRIERACVVVLSLASPYSTLAQTARQSPGATMPEPPRRPASLERAPAAPPPMSQPASSPLSKPVEAPAIQAQPSRAAPIDAPTLRACAVRWQAMKLDGSVGVRIWREFAQDCATQGREAAPDDPASKR